MTRQLELTEVSPEAALTAAGFEQVERETLESEIRIFPARAFYPSSIGHPCGRFIVWGFNRTEDKARHSPTLQAIFDEGRAHQPLIYARLEQMGFALVRESDRPVQYRPRGAQGPVISGRPDGRIIGFRGTKYRPPWLLEAKSMSGYAWDHTHGVEDLRDSPNVWTRSYYAQGQLGQDPPDQAAFVVVVAVAPRAVAAAEQGGTTADGREPPGEQQREGRLPRSAHRQVSHADHGMGQGQASRLLAQAVPPGDAAVDRRRRPQGRTPERGREPRLGAGRDGAEIQTLTLRPTPLVLWWAPSPSARVVSSSSSPIRRYFS